MYGYLFLSTVVIFARGFHPRSPFVFILANMGFAPVAYPTGAVEFEFFSLFDVEWPFDVVLVAIVISSIAHLNPDIVVSG